MVSSTVKTTFPALPIHENFASGSPAVEPLAFGPIVGAWNRGVGVDLVGGRRGGGQSGTAALPSAHLQFCTSTTQHSWGKDGVRE